VEQNEKIFGELPKIVIGEIITIAILCFVYIGLGKFDSAVLFGCLLGAGTNIFCFVILCLTVEKMIREKDNPRQAKVTQLVSYLFRMGLMGVALIIALKNDSLESICTAVPLLMTRPILTVTSLIEKKKEGKNESIN